MTSRYFILAAALINSPVTQSRSVDAPKISSDPFARPRLIAKPANSSEPAEGASESIWNPILLSTLRAGQSSMVNVAGRILMLGEEIDGFKLIEVKERSAVFEKAGNRHTLEMDSRANDADS